MIKDPSQFFKVNFSLIPNPKRMSSDTMVKFLAQMPKGDSFYLSHGHPSHEPETQHSLRAEVVGIEPEGILPPTSLQSLNSAFGIWNYSNKMSEIGLADKYIPLSSFQTLRIDLPPVLEIFLRVI